MKRPRGGRTAVAISIACHATLVVVFWSTLWIAVRSPEVVAEIASDVAPVAQPAEPVAPPEEPELPPLPSEPMDPTVIESEPPAEEPFAPLADPLPVPNEIAIPAHRVAAIKKIPNLRREALKAEVSTSPPIAVSIPTGVTRRARLLPGNPAPRYPDRAVRLSKEGTVLLVAYVSVGGLVERLEIRKSSGHEVLDRAALDAVEGWRFAPALSRGVRIASRIEVPVRFALR